MPVARPASQSNWTSAPRSLAPVPSLARSAAAAHPVRRPASCSRVAGASDREARVPRGSLLEHVDPECQPPVVLEPQAWRMPPARHARSRHSRPGTARALSALAGAGPAMHRSSASQGSSTATRTLRDAFNPHALLLTSLRAAASQDLAVQQHAASSSSRRPAAISPIAIRIEPVLQLEYARVQALLRVPGAHGEARLADHRAAIQFGGDEVHAGCRARGRRPAAARRWVCRPLCLGSSEGWMFSRRPAVTRYETRRQDAHEARQHHELGGTAVDRRRRVRLSKAARSAILPWRDHAARRA